LEEAEDLKKRARYNIDHGPYNIPIASATWLSQWDPWLSVPRLLVVWLYRYFFINESDLLKSNFNAKRDWMLKPIDS